jgi:hypothetical protein
MAQSAIGEMSINPAADPAVWEKPDRKGSSPFLKGSDGQV